MQYGPGGRWENALKAAADRCEALLFLISPSWLKSAWCLSEFLLAKQLGKLLFPLLIDRASIEMPPSKIASDHQAVDLVGDPVGWRRVKGGLRRAGLDPDADRRVLLRYPLRAALCEEVHLNLAYRWFCRLGLGGDVPDSFHLLEEPAWPFPRERWRDFFRLL